MGKPTGIRPLEPKIMKKWDKFLEWIHKEKHVSKGCWTPNYMSILLWEEFNKRL